MYEEWHGFNSAERVKSNGMEPPIASLPASCWTPRSHTLSRPPAIPRNLSQRCGVQVLDFRGGMGSMMFNACFFSGIQFDGPSFSRDWFLEKSSQHLKKRTGCVSPLPCVNAWCLCWSLWKMGRNFTQTKIPGKRHCTNVACQINDCSPNE